MKFLRHIILTVAVAFAATDIAAVAADTAYVSFEQSGMDTPSIVIKSRTLEITVSGDSAEVVEVYTLTGQIVRRMSVEPGIATSVELAPGYYIVRIAGLSKRIVIR